MSFYKDFLRTTRSKIALYSVLTRQNRPVGTLLLLGPVSWGLVVAANGNHDWLIITVFVLGTWLMRSAGCVINDYADRDFDRHVERTKNRPLTTGELSCTEVLTVFVVLSASALILVLLLRIEVLFASVLALILASIYPFTKRFTWFPQIFLGLAFSWSIPMTFVAYSGSVPVQGWAMFLLSSIWITAYDTIYAMLDYKDDRLIGIKSTALFFGRHTAMVIAIMYGLFILGWAQAAWFHGASVGFWLALLCVIICFVYQIFLVRTHDQTKIFRAFTNNQWVGLVVFLGLLFF